MIVYLYSKCSTCQEAKRFLEKKKVVITIKEITETPPSVAELKKMLQFQNDNIKKLLNTSGLQYRSMGLSQKLNEMSIEEILVLLSQNGMLIKRPFLLGDKFGLLGFKESEWAQNL